MILQVPAPIPPIDPVIVVGGGGPPVEAIIVMVTVIVGGILLYPVLRAWARRIEGRGSSELQGEIDALHDRLAGVETMEVRLQELENRVEFSERLLARSEHAPGGDEKGR